MLENILAKWGGVEVSAMHVYTDMFRLGENEIQRKGEESGLYKANPIAYWRNVGEVKGNYRIMLDDTFEETLKELQEADFAIINGISYFGRKNVQEHASKMYAMIFDIDGMTDKSLNAFLNGAFAKEYDIYPIPNYVILSGHGVHLYYIFEYPVPLYPNIKLQLKALKYALIERMWNMYTSTEEKKQFQGINQGFRVIGGKTKIDGVRVRAFRINEHPFSLQQLNRYIPKESRIDESKLYKESKMSLAEAKKKYPQWYEDKVVNKQPRQYWTCKRDLYDWWIRKVKEGATFRHRYFSIMCLAIYGVKCRIEFEQVKADAFKLIPFLDSIRPDEPFTENDCLSALECYDKRYCTFPINDIVKISGIEIEKNTRNGRKQIEHLQAEYWENEKGRPEVNTCKQNRELALKFMRDNGEIKGRPVGTGTKEALVKEYVLAHPGESVSEIAKNLGISRPTVYKYIAELKPNTLEQAEKDIESTLKAPKAEFGANTKPQEQILRNETPEQRKRRRHKEWQERMKRQREEQKN